MTSEIPPDRRPNKSDTSSRKWSVSSTGQAAIVGCGVPIFLFLLALIFSVDEFALLIPIIFVFFTLPLLVIGAISDGKARASDVANTQEDQVDQVPPTTNASEEASEETVENPDDQDTTSKTVTNDIPPTDLPNESSGASRKWYQSCGGQIMMTGCAAPLLLVVFAVIEIFTTCGGNANESTCGAAAVGFVIPIVVLFVTVPLLIIGGIVLGVSRPAQVIQVEEKSDNQDSPVVSSSQKVAEPFSTFSLLSGLSTLAAFFNVLPGTVAIDPQFSQLVISLPPIMAIIFAVIAWRKKERFMVLALTLAGVIAIPYLLLPLLTFFIF